MRPLLFALLLVASCATPKILLDKAVLSAEPPSACPPGFEDTSFPTSGRVRCDAPEWHDIHAMKPAP